MVKIYSLKDPVTGQIRYIGKTSSDLKKRLRYHIYDLKKTKNSHKKHWFNQLLLIGQTPIIELVDEVPEDNWGYWEEFYIQLFKQWGFKLINFLSGGEGYSSQDVRNLWLREDYRKKNTERMIGDKNPFFGKTHTEETKAILRSKCPHPKGESHPSYGKVMSIESIEKNRLSQPTIKKISRFSLDGVLIDSWVGIKRMCATLNLDEGAVCRVLKGKNRHHKNFVFKYDLDYLIAS